MEQCSIVEFDQQKDRQGHHQKRNHPDGDDYNVGGFQRAAFVKFNPLHDVDVSFYRDCCNQPEGSSVKRIHQTDTRTGKYFCRAESKSLLVLVALLWETPQAKLQYRQFRG